MSIKDAVVLRFRHLCMERLITWNELATRSGVTPSTVYSMLDPRRRELSVVTEMWYTYFCKRCDKEE